jgi:chemotaxis regulatin CheY-phosphate phosphatase CheZ
MDKNTNMDDVFEKLGELKSFFVFGQRVVPVIQSIIDFMRDVVPLMEYVNNSIQDSASKIPKAASQINSVTNATEMATSEILDIIDSMTLDISKIKNELSDLKNGFFNQRVTLENYGNQHPNLNGQFEVLQSGLSIDELEAKVLSLEEIVQKIEVDSNNITLSLQVQDITSQQLASVNHLIQSVQKRLSKLINDLSKKGPVDLGDFEMEDDTRKGSTFNPDARYEKSPEKQKLANELFDSGLKTSQDEIDKLFSK